MPFKTFGLACAVVVLSSPLARAQVNFDELFNSIAFSDDAPPPLPVEPPPQPPAPRESGGGESGVGEPGGGEPVQPEQRSPEQLPLGELDPSERSLLLSPPAPVLNEPIEVEQPDDVPRDDSAHSAAGSGQRVDFDALLSDVDEAPTRLFSPPHPLVAPPHPHRAHRPHAVAPSCDSACRQPALGPQPDCTTCVTYTRPTPCLDHPNLPSPTSLEAYYRTPACYRDLWGGYHQQRQYECQSHHKHLHGHCECLHSQHPPAVRGQVR